jgi:RNA polymerase sigma-70 factor (family 1)
MSEYANLSDNELYALTDQSIEEAFTVLYQRYWKRMLYKALQKLESETDAEEVVQDAFIDLWNSRHRIRIQYSFHTYIAAIVKYKIMAKMAANKKVLYRSAGDISSFSIADNSTQEWLAYDDLREEFEQAVKGLPEKCRLVFRMSRVEEKSDREIAAELGVSQKTVEAHKSKALKALGKLRRSMNQFLVC